MSRARAYVFTLNNYEPSDIDHLAQVPCRYLIYGYEVGESGTPHLQGFVYFDNAKSFTATKDLISPRAHIERAKRIKEAIEYCKKEGDYVEHGEVPSQGKRTDLEVVTEMVKAGASTKEIASTYPIQYVKFHRGINALKLTVLEPYDHSDVRGLWYVGKPGTGKSSYARTYDNIYLKSQNKWWDGYDGQQTVVLDDFDEGGKCLGHLLKIWTDRYACTGETKGGTVHLRHHRLIVTSNYSLAQLFGETPEIYAALKRRFTVFNFDMHKYHPEVEPEQW